MAQKALEYHLWKPETYVSVCCSERLNVSYIKELISIFRSFGIDNTLAIPFVAKVAALILQIVLGLLLNRQVKYLLANPE